MTVEHRVAGPRRPGEDGQMASQQTETHSPAELAFGVSLEELVGAEEVQPVTDGFLVTFPEADFVIRLSGAGATPCETDWEVTVREPLPGLSTWWGHWHRSF